jgi:biopolymer transport protein ExbD
MNTLTRNISATSRGRIWAVTLIALATGFFVIGGGEAQTLQKGVSVQLAVSTNAAPMPEADNADAFIVSITENGTIYLGVNQITASDLKEKVRSTPFKRGQKLYIKADARTPYAKVLQVLDATRSGGIAPQVLLTAATESSKTGTIVPPEGVEVQLGR